MAVSRSRISPCLWFDDQAEEAAKFYCSIFERSGIDLVSRYGKEGFEIHGRPEGSVMTVDFHLDGNHYTALNGGPHFKFNEAVSFQVFCDSQAEIDRFWKRLTEGGEEGHCGWLKDRYGLSWQVGPSSMEEMMRSGDRKKLDAVMKELLQMRKLDVATLERAYREA